jgi:hypothetical protein
MGTRAPRAWLAAGLVLALGAAAAGSQPLTDPREIMQRVDARPRGRDQKARAIWRLVSKSGDERVRETRTFWRDARGDGAGLHSQRLLVFVTPPDVKDTAFLIWNQLDPARDDDQWIYLPGLRKVRRIAVGDRGTSFVGTDFAYDDLVERQVDEDGHVLLRSVEHEGALHHLIEATPKRPAPYAKRIVWVRDGDFTTPRIEFVDPAGTVTKTLEASWTEVNGIWTWKQLVMTNARSGHKTIVDVDQVVYDTGLGPDVFSESALRAGAP